MDNSWESWGLIWHTGDTVDSRLHRSTLTHEPGSNLALRMHFWKFALDHIADSADRLWWTDKINWNQGVSNLIKKVIQSGSHEEQWWWWWLKIEETRAFNYQSRISAESVASFAYCFSVLTSSVYVHRELHVLDQIFQQTDLCWTHSWGLWKHGTSALRSSGLR